jgi:hypothetical protein
MRYRLRTLLIVLIGGASVFAAVGGGFAANADWHANYGGDHVPFTIWGAAVGGGVGLFVALALISLNKFQLRFSVRELMLLTFAIAASLGWWLGKVRYDREVKFYKGEIQKGWEIVASLRRRIDELEHGQPAKATERNSETSSREND